MPIRITQRVLLRKRSGNNKRWFSFRNSCSEDLRNSRRVLKFSTSTKNCHRSCSSCLYVKKSLQLSKFTDSLDCEWSRLSSIETIWDELENYIENSHPKVHTSYKMLLEMVLEAWKSQQNSPNPRACSRNARKT